MILDEKRISIVGFGNQGSAWALNLKDSGINVKVALRTGSKLIRKATDNDFEVVNIKQAFLNSDIICILIPDEAHPELFEKYGQYLDDGQSIVFAHGYNIHYNLLNIQHNVDTLLVAPKGTGDSLRETYLKGSGIPALIAVDKDATGHGWQITKLIAENLGCNKVGIYKSTFKEETEINLFSEQAFYLSSLPKAIQETFDALVESGYSREASYYETLHKVKIFGDIIQKKGLLDTYKSVSSVARIGGVMSHERLIDTKYKDETRKILKEIQDGTFIKKFDEERNSGLKNVSGFLDHLKESSIETLGKKLREKAKINE